MAGIFPRMLWIFTQPSPNLPGKFTFLLFICQVHPFNLHALLHSGKMFSLLMADKLGDYIVGTAVETIETEKLIKEFENVIVDDVYGGGTSIDTVTSQLQEKLNKKGRKINTISVDNVYNETSVTKANTNIWYTAKKVGDATGHITPVRVFFYSFLYISHLNSFELLVTYASNARRLCFQGEIARRCVRATGH